MARWLLAPVLLASLLSGSVEAQSPPAADKSPHTPRSVTVNGDVKIEVLDWGGTGRAVILLAGLGDTAHVFDEFATKLTPRYHVYGFTRRGFGNSSKPQPGRDNYSADRLADDVLEAMAALGLHRPVVVGHSIAGSELSSIGSRHPAKVAGLVYLDAAGPSAFYDAKQGNYGVELADVRRKLDRLSDRSTREVEMANLREILDSDSLRRLEKQLKDVLSQMESVPAPAPGRAVLRVDPLTPFRNAILSSQQIFTRIEGPILSIVALPHDYQRDPPPQSRAVTAIDIAYATRQAEAFQEAMPSARVVRLPYANHRVFSSNEADVLREMHSFIGSLP